MRRALFLATRGSGRTSPNPLVGAVVVSPDGVVVGHGAHERAGEPHAEVHALNEAGPRARGGTLYCTLEPCSHTGRTGPCVVRIAEAGIARVVAAVQDPNPRVQGRGFASLRARGIAVDTGVGEEAAIRLNQPFFTFIREQRPFVILKAATSLDGRIAAAAGRRTPLTSAAADRRTHRLRATVDAIAVGAGTMRADDPLLTVRGVYRERPFVRVVFDRRLQTPASARIFSTLDQGPVIMMASAEAAADPRLAGPLQDAGAELVVVDPAGGVRAALAGLAARDITSLLVEGGAALHAAFWDAGLVDYLHVYVTPHALGAEGVPFAGGRPVPLAGLFDRRVEPCGPDVLIEGYVHRPH
ncbi:MAG: bifunctional diaminohydroxyphosphoribosylaminopyrimidine deaminase/5-amino-6-(5-phosphoribosylamino)uracil reductase RibD [Acidobacteriota bacterium]|nr:bifunctional diaminohydroxyphosphoribosylaminopyrimidine deaminase/5-amino-6-(5-phosphoribosylamino)uracil reductase RibD [Acidobacteriota bacterium]